MRFSPKQLAGAFALLVIIWLIIMLRLLLQST